MAGCFGEPDISGDHSGKHLAGEMLPHFLRYLGGEIGSAVEHGQNHAEDLQRGVDLLFDQP